MKKILFLSVIFSLVSLHTILVQAQSPPLKVDESIVATQTLEGRIVYSDASLVKRGDGQWVKPPQADWITDIGAARFGPAFRIKSDTLFVSDLDQIKYISIAGRTYKINPPTLVEDLIEVDPAMRPGHGSFFSKPQTHITPGSGLSIKPDGWIEIIDIVEVERLIEEGEARERARKVKAKADYPKPYRSN